MRIARSGYRLAVSDLVGGVFTARLRPRRQGSSRLAGASARSDAKRFGPVMSPQCPMNRPHHRIGRRALRDLDAVRATQRMLGLPEAS